MDVMINWVGVGLATLASFIVGSIWYAPPVFGETWRKLIKMDTKTMQKGPGSRGWALTVVGAFLQAYVLANVAYLSFQFFDNSWMSATLTTALWVWLGFQLSMLFTHDSFEQRRLKLTALTAGSQLATLLLMAVALGLFQP